MTAYSHFRENFHSHAILRYIGLIALGAGMGEFMDLSSSAFPLQLISGVVCTAALGLYALFQPASDDDDSNGGGGGGLMQPVA